MPLEQVLKTLTPQTITLKALDTGQVIYPSDRNYCQITPLDPETCRITYRCYSSDTRVAILVRRLDPNKLSITVESYLPSPLFKTRCNLYMDCGLVIEDLGANLGKTLICAPPPKPPPPQLRATRENVLRRVVHMATFGVQCGIATYLESLIDRLVPLNKEIEQVVFAEKIPEGDTRESTGKGYKGNQPTLLRNWTRRQPIHELMKDLAEYDPDILHIQHEWSFFPPSAAIFPEILASTWKKGTANIVTWHTVYGTNEIDQSTMRRFMDRVKPHIDMHIVHEANSYNNLLAYKVEPSKLRLIPMSAYPVRDIGKDEARRKMLPEKYWNKKILMTGGFLLPNKGVEKIMLGISALKDPDLALVCIGGSHPWSGKYYQDYHDLIINAARQTRIDLYLDYRFMDDEEITWYMACADIVILYYGWTLSGTSGWSRRAIASKRPIIATDVRLMSDIQDKVHCVKVPPRAIGELSHAIVMVLDDDGLQRTLVENASKYAEEISPINIAKRHMELYNEVYAKCQLKNT
jgi:glycosyltransferase involved in cell wall biosynthesis